MDTLKTIDTWCPAKMEMIKLTLRVKKKVGIYMQGSPHECFEKKNCVDQQSRNCYLKQFLIEVYDPSLSCPKQEYNSVELESEASKDEVE